MNVVISSSGTLELPGSGLRTIRFDVVSNGCMIFGECYGDRKLLFAGENRKGVKGVIDGRFLEIYLSKKDGVAALALPELRNPVDGVEWFGDESYTDLDPKPFGTISPEIQAVMDRMNRNAIIREQALLRALGQRE